MDDLSAFIRSPPHESWPNKDLEMGNNQLSTLESKKGGGRYKLLFDNVGTHYVIREGGEGSAEFVFHRIRTSFFILYRMSPHASAKSGRVEGA